MSCLQHGFVACSLGQLVHCVQSTEVWHSSQALGVVLEGICYSALFSPHSFFVVVLDASTGKDASRSSLLTSTEMYCTLKAMNVSVSTITVPVFMYKRF